MRIRSYVTAIITAMVLVSSASGAPGEVTGKISQVTEKFVVMKDAKYAVLRGGETNLKVTSGTTQCYANQVRITCGTLAAVGYVDHARLVVDNGNALRIDVLRMLQ